MPANGLRHPSLSQTYQERASLSGTPALASYFLRLIAAKKTNLCVSADVSTTRELLQLAEEVGDHICLLKTHADIIHDFGGKTFQDLQAIAKRKGFLIFEDRKFGDIGNTVQLQYTSGPLQIVRWANIVNAHIFPGPAIVTALAQAADDATAAYNTSVETQITGPSELATDGEPEPEVDESGLRTPPVEEQDGDCLSSEESDDDDESNGEPVTYSDDDQVGDLTRTASRRLSSPNEMERKFSVVSVSTTISTKTEHISPQPTPLHHRGFSEGLNAIAAADHTDPQKALQNLGEPPMARGLLLLAQMSSAGNLMDESYASQCVQIARSRTDFVLGFIAQRSLNTQPSDNFITMTPGVQIGSKGDGLGQQYNTPEAVIGSGSDVIIVGRGIYAAQDRKQAAAEYRDRAWRAYEERVGLGRA